MGKSANLPAKIYSVGQPTQTRLSFEGTGSSTQFIDIGLALSAVNQRSYRSGLYYYVTSVEFYDNANSMVDIHTLPNTYAVKNAWSRAFSKYMKMLRLADNGVPLPRGKWHDFRVYMSDLHRTSGTTPPALHGVNNTNAALPIDEGNLYSELISADSDGDISDPGTVNAAVNQEADNFKLHFLGPHVGSADNWTSVGIITSYDAAKIDISASSGDPVYDANEISSDPLANLFDFSSEEQVNDIIDYVETYGDLPPYDRDSLNGMSADHMQQQMRLVTSAGINRVAKGGGFVAPFGLIAIDPMTGSDSHAVTDAWRVVINVAEGTYHGVHAERVN